MRVEKKSLVVDGVRLAFEEYGTGEVILFLHGFGASSYSWRPVARSIAEQWGKRCICLDLMGFGESDKPVHEKYTIDRHASLITHFLQSLEISSLSLAGHSYGGGVSLVLLHRHDAGKTPFQIQNLILVSSPCFPMPTPDFIKLLSIPLLPRLLLKIIPSRTVVFRAITYDLPELKRSSATVTEYAECMKKKGAHRALINSAKHISPPNLEEIVLWYSKISIPVLLLWGNRDLLIPLKIGKRLNKEIPHSELQIIADCGHIPQEQYPDITTNLISNFVS
ncbi:alpha/beta hydrolase [bacterium]|jgi:pimeloyl-ACP methyl ester carboxylesterase|nr:alpha/beta hydrolase [bacterium]